MKMIVVFEKTPRLRMIGHLDLMRAMQRALRRSDLPLRYSQGFNPHILLTFAAPLSLGMAGRREIMEVPLEKEMTPEAFKAQFSAALPPDLPLVSCTAVDDRHPAPMAQLSAASYEAKLDAVPESFGETLTAFLNQPEIPAMRKTKTGLKPCDIRPMIYALSLTGDTLCMTLALCEKATCKPDLLLDSLFAFAQTQRPRTHIVRTQMLGEQDGVLLPLESL